MLAHATIATALVALLLAVPTHAASAAPHEKTFKTGLLLRYELRARDVRIASASVSVGPKQTVAGRSVRAVTIDGKSDDLIGLFYQGTLSATSWLLAADWSPVRAQWRNRISRNHSDTDARYDGKRLQAAFVRPEKPRTDIDRSFDRRPQDMVSVLPWLVQQKVRTGQKLTAPLYVGQQVCELHAEVGAAQIVTVPLGSRTALPVALRMTDCTITRTATVWLDAQDWTPHKISVSDPWLGSVDVLLRGVESADVAAIVPQGKTL